MGARLSGLNRRTLRALGDTLFPASGAGEPAGGEVVVGPVEELVGRMEAHKRRAFGALLSVFELGAIARFGRTFSRLGPEARERYVDAWMRSRFAPQRAAFRALRQTCGIAYYQDPRTWGHLGYAGPKKDAAATAAAGAATAAAGGAAGDAATAEGAANGRARSAEGGAG